MRYPSVDILRTVAIVVMVMVHFPENLSGYVPGYAGLGAPLFTFLSGVSYFLWVQGRQKCDTSDEEISKISIRRGLFVMGVGFAFNVFVWMPEDTFIWDVLTFIGTAILVLNLVRKQPPLILVTLAVVAVAISPALRASADWDAYWVNGYFEGDLTLTELLAGFLATGYFPVFPWIAYSLTGFVVGAYLFPADQSQTGINKVVACGLLLGGVVVAARICHYTAPAALVKHVFAGWSMMPPSLEYIAATLGGGMLLLAVLHRTVDQNEALRKAGWMTIFKTFSRYAFTVYILHHVVHLYPLWIYGYVMTGEPTIYWRNAMHLAVAFPLGVLFLGVCYLVFSRIDADRRFGIEGWMRWLCG